MKVSGILYSLFSILLIVGALLSCSSPTASSPSSPPWVPSIFAGSSQGFQDNDPQFDRPNGVAVFGTGNDLIVYVADTNNHRIRKITPNGVVTTFAGSGIGGFANGPGTSARFSFPRDVAIDSTGNLYIADTNNNRIRKIAPQNDGTVMVTTFAGSTKGYRNAPGTSAQFDRPSGVAIDSLGNLYVADTNNNRIRKIAPQNDGTVMVTTFAGSTKGDRNGPGTSAQFYYPSDVAIDSTGNLYIADTNNNRIRKIAPQNDGTVMVTTFAGSRDGHDDGTGTQAQFSRPHNVVFDSSDNLYVADSWNDRIRKITPGGEVSTFAGSSQGFANDTGGRAEFDYPSGVAIDSSGNVYVGDSNNDLIRKITPNREVSTLAGSGTAGFRDTVNSTKAKFNSPTGVWRDSSGNLYVADRTNHRIRKITKSGSDDSATYTVSTIAGTGTAGFMDHYAGTSARFDDPTGVAVDSSGNVYVADSDNHRIRKIAPNGAVITLAGRSKAGHNDATGALAQFDNPFGVAVDSSGNVYVADSDNHRIRKITPEIEVSTFAGSSTAGDRDATGALAGFRNPAGVAVDSSGNVYVADKGNHLIRRITSTRAVTTIAGTAGESGSADGPGVTTARFNEPTGLTIDSSGNIYVVDQGGNRIRKLTKSGSGDSATYTVSTLASNRLSSPTGVAIDSSGETYYVTDTGNHLIRSGKLSDSQD